MTTLQLKNLCEEKAAAGYRYITILGKKRRFYRSKQEMADDPQFNEEMTYYTIPVYIETLEEELN